MAKAYVMNKSVLRRIRIKNCAKCGKPIENGDLVVSKRSTSKFKHYHKSCYESLFSSG